MSKLELMPTIARLVVVALVEVLLVKVAFVAVRLVIVAAVAVSPPLNASCVVVALPMNG